MDPVTAGIIGAGLGFGASSMFGGKGKKGKLYLPSLSARGRAAQERLYADIRRGLAGGGFSPWMGKNIREMELGYKEAMPGARQELSSQMNRFLPKGDVRAREHAEGMLNRGYYGLQNQLREMKQEQSYMGMLEAQEAGLGLLAGEKRMSMAGSNMYNQYAQQMGNMPTFGSQLGYGLGGAAGWAALMSQQGGVG